MTVKRKIERIVSLVMEISPPDVKYNNEEKPVAFFSYSGHCPCLNVEVCENGWKQTETTQQKQNFYVYNMYNKEYAKEVNQQLDEIINYLEKVKRRK
jgi:hypothetical protein